MYCINWFRNIPFQDFDHGHNPLITNLVKRALDCIKGSIKTQPSISFTLIQHIPSNVGYYWSSMFLPQRKLQIKLCIFLIANLQNSQTDAINHIEASNTKFATTTRPAKDNCWASQYSSLRFIDNSNGDSIASGLKSIPTIHPKFQIVSSWWSHRQEGPRYHAGWVSSPIQRLTHLFQLSDGHVAFFIALL